MGWLSWLGLEQAAYWAKTAIIFIGHLGVHGRGQHDPLSRRPSPIVPEELYEALGHRRGPPSGSNFGMSRGPMIAPTTFFICVMSIIGGLQGGFEIAYLMTNGGPGKDGDNTVTLGYYIYRSAFEKPRVRVRGRRVAWFMFVIIFTITLFNWRFRSGRGQLREKGAWPKLRKRPRSTR